MNTMCFIDVLHLLDTNNLLQLRRVSKELKYFINNNLKYFKIICNKKIVDNDLKYLAGVHTIDLCGCKLITDEGLKYLAGVHTIIINKCK